MLMQILCTSAFGSAGPAVGWDFVVGLFQLSSLQRVTFRLFALLSTINQITQRRRHFPRFPPLMGNTGKTITDLALISSHFDSTTQDFRCPFQLCCTWKPRVFARCSVMQLHRVLSEAVTRVFVSHVFHLVLQRLCFFGEPVLSIWRAQWFTAVWPSVV